MAVQAIQIGYSVDCAAVQRARPAVISPTLPLLPSLAVLHHLPVLHLVLFLYFNRHRTCFQYTPRTSIQSKPVRGFFSCNHLFFSDNNHLSSSETQRNLPRWNATMAHYDPLHPAASPNVQTFDQASFNPEAQPLRSYPEGIPPGAAPPHFYQLSDDGPLRNPAPLGNFGEPQPRDSIVSYGTGSPYARDSAFAPGTPGASTTFLGGNAPGSYHDDPYSSTSRFDTNVPMSPMGGSRELEKDYAPPPPKKKGSSWIRCGVAILVVLLIAIAVLIPVYFKFLKPSALAAESGSTGSGGGGGSSGGGGGGGGGGGATPQHPITGGDGSTVQLTDGGTMTYVNKFGGYWVEDPSNPFDNSARPQSWTKPLNESWDYSNDKIMGWAPIFSFFVSRLISLAVSILAAG